MNLLNNFLNKCFTTFKKHPYVFGSLLLFLITFLAFGTTLGLYVWQDDHAVMFKLQHLAESAGHFGTGIYDKSSIYRGVMVPLAPIYWMFGNNPQAFYFFGILGYFLATLAVFFFAQTLFQNRRLAFATATIFASGYIGAESMWRIFNSLHTSNAIIATCLTLGFFKKFIDLRKINLFKSLIYYLLSIALFFYAVETGYVRTHGLILSLLALELFWDFHPIFSFLRMIPFVKIFADYFLGVSSSSELTNLIQRVVIDKELVLTQYFFKNLEYIFIPSTYYFPVSIFMIILLIILTKFKDRILFYSIIFAVVSFLVYYIHSPTILLESNQRYLTISLIGFSLFIPQLLDKITRKQKKFFYVILAIVITHIILTNIDTLNLIKTQSNPTRNFYQVLKKEVPKIEKRAVFYFDVKQEKESLNRFAGFFGVGSMPNETAIAWQYGVDRYDLKIVNNFTEILAFDNFYTFYYSLETGLINTTPGTRNALSGTKNKRQIFNIQNINEPFSSPIKIDFRIYAEIDQSKITFKEDDINDINTYLDYLTSKDSYYEIASISAGSEWKYQEIKYIKDQDNTTTWKGQRTNWHQHPVEEVIINLGEIKTVSAAKLTHKYVNSTPKDYTYSCSQNEKNWVKLGNFSFTPHQESGYVLNKFDSSECKFIKLDITGTNGDDSPQIAELEIIEDAYKDIDFEKVDQIAADPFAFINSPKTQQVVLNFINSNGIPSNLCYLTDKSNQPYCIDFKATLNVELDYSIIIPPNGTKLASIYFVFPSNIKYELKNFFIKHLTYDELIAENYVK